VLDSTTRQLTALHRAHLEALAPRLAELALYPGSELLLAEVASHEGIALGELAARLGVSPPSVTKVVARLVRDGLLARISDREDGRVSRVELTASGRRVMPHVREAWAAAEAEVLAPLSPAQSLTFDRLIRRALGYPGSG
jgi:DNA-binding MarR family transcriptional regulator